MSMGKVSGGNHDNPERDNHQNRIPRVLGEQRAPEHGGQETVLPQNLQAPTLLALACLYLSRSGPSERRGAPCHTHQ